MIASSSREMTTGRDRDNESKRYTGSKLKWYDDFFVKASSSSPTNDHSPTIQDADRVELSHLTTDSKSPSFDRVQTGPKCYICARIGHFPHKCPQKTSFRDRCYRCGRTGHFARNCRTKDNVVCVKRRQDVQKVEEVEDCFILDFDPNEKPNHGKDNVPRKGLEPVVCVKNRKDVKKVEQVEDCFILDFDPTKIDDDEDGGGLESDDECRVIRSIVCVKSPEEVKRVEEVEDCFILEFDPTEPIKFSNLSLSDESQSSSTTDAQEDVSILAEKGQVACRDYPHPRHICATHPFKITDHKLHCKMCYCYICDIPAPCIDWTPKIGFAHSDASADILLCRELRNHKMKKENAEVW